MNFIQRKYCGEADKSLMAALTRACFSENPQVIDLPYRLSSWALDEPDNVGLWVDEDNRLAAWAVLQTPFWTIDYVLGPDPDQGLGPQILAWADQRAQMTLTTPYGHPSWYASVFSDQTRRKQELEQAGFTDLSEAGEEAWSQVWMVRDGQSILPSYPLPVGFTLRSLAGENEVEAYVELHRDVFGTKNMTVEWRMRTLSHSDYNPELDVVVAGPGSKLVAFCIGWLGRAAGGELYGQIEPLGCHTDYRKYGLGRVALCETLRRLQQKGVRKIIVESDSYHNTAYRLYEAVGFRVTRDILIYRKDYNELTK